MIVTNKLSSSCGPPVPPPSCEDKLTLSEIMGHSVKILGLFLGFVVTIPLYLLSSSAHKSIDGWFYEIRTGERQVRELRTPLLPAPSSQAQKISKQVIGSESTATKSESLTAETSELFPEMLNQVRVINRNIGGSTGAELVEDHRVRKFVRKTAGSGAKITAQHLRTEYHTNKAYKALGVMVPEVTLYNPVTGQQIRLSEKSPADERPVMLSHYVPGNTQPLKDYLSYPKMSSHPHFAKVQALVQKHFVADCLLANWDVVGLEYDNMRINVDTNEIWRIDNGAGLDYRAQGKKKDAASFTSVIKEFKTMRDPDINSEAAKLFGSITDAEIVRQIDEILPHRAAFLAAIPARLKDIMTQRFDYLSVYKQQLKNR